MAAPKRNYELQKNLNWFYLYLVQ